MICISKADKDSIRHLSFNQSPPALSPNGTTRQDLNGMANLREYVDAGQDGEGGGGGGRGGACGCGLCGSDASDCKMRREGDPPGLPSAAAHARRWFNSSPLRCKAVSGGDDQTCSHWVPSPRCLAHLWGWGTWILSVLLVSCLLSSLSSPAGWMPLRTAVYTSSSPPLTAHSSIKPASQSPWPAPQDLEQVSKSPIEPSGHVFSKRAQCHAGGVSDEDAYNTPLHGAAIFIIWFVSTLGCAFPIMASKFPGLRIPRRFFFTVRHFGTGVLIATAFVHLLPTAFISLGDPCLGSFWNTDYQAMPGAIALAAIFLVTIIEMVFHPSRQMSNRNPSCCEDGSAVEDQPDNGRCMGTMAPPVRKIGSVRGRSSSIGQGLSQLHQNTADQIRESSQRGADVESGAKSPSDESTVQWSETPVMTAEQKQKKDRLQCILLEMGILFHSVFIGMALSVSIGSDFVVLLIAIIFHQTFEGLALGSRISAINWQNKTWQPWLMAMAYGFTTPLGQAIGLATHTLYSPDSEVGLILVGVMNAISAGLLTFASLVELLSEDFLSDESWRILRGKRRVIACLLVFFGAFFMSLVGAWA